MSKASAPALTGEIRVVMENLVELEERVHDDLRIYMWRPRQPDLPCLWNWLSPGTLEQRDLGRHRDNLVIQANISIRHTDMNDEMDRITLYTDIFRDVIDRELFAPRPLGCQRAMRQGLSMQEVRFNDVPTLTMVFPLAVQVDRMIYAS